MKKMIAGIVCLAMCITFCGASPVLAAESTSEVKWKGDYSDSSNVKLIISVDSAIPYNHRVTAAMYEENAVAAPGNIKRITEVPVTPKGKKDISLTIGNDLNYKDSNGDMQYKLKVRGSGSKGSLINETLEVYVLTPNRIGGILTAINGAATHGEILAAVVPLEKPLQTTLAVDSNYTDYFKISRAEDFNNTFSTIADFEKSWKIAEIVETIQNYSTTDITALKNKVETNASVIGIDTNDEDYAAVADDVYTDILGVKTTYGTTPGIKSALALKKAYTQYQAMETIDAMSVDEDIAGKIAKYYSALEISADTQTKFTNLGPNDQEKVERAIADNSRIVNGELVGSTADYSTPKEIADAFKKAVEDLTPDGDGDTGDGGSGDGGSGGGSGGGGGGGVTINDSSQTVVPSPTPAQAGFKDCGSSHWANTYVNSLKQKNIINGYEDGKFYPENKVTREEFIKMIISAVGLYNTKSECEFNDVPNNEWYYKFVASAVKEGIISGIAEGKFGTGQNITREDMAVIASRTFARFGKLDKTSGAEFADAESISDYAAESVNTLCGMGVINGFNDGTFRPAASLTRAEAAKIIYMIMEKVIE
jgi:hypothetical protein